MHHPAPLPRQSFVRSTLAFFIVGASMFSAACGLKAPLYLPDEKEQEVAAAGQGANKRRVTNPKPAPAPPADPDRSATPPGT